MKPPTFWRRESENPEDWPSDLPRPRAGFRVWDEDRFLEGYLPQSFELITRSGAAPGWCYRCPTCQTRFGYLPAAEFHAITASPLSALESPARRRIVCIVCLPRLMGR